MLGLAHSIQTAPLTLAWDHDQNSVASLITSASLIDSTHWTTFYFVQSDGVFGARLSEGSGQLPVVQPLTIWCPNPLLTSLDGKAVRVTLTPKVTGEVTPITTTCSPTSGSLFPVGSASFTCNAVDARRQEASCTSNVVVMSVAAQPAPQLSLTCPTIAPVTESRDGGRTAVRFADPTFSGGTAPVTVSCIPKSGSQFSVGTTAVSCQATDAARQTAACVTSATVIPGSHGGDDGK